MSEQQISSAEAEGDEHYGDVSSYSHFRSPALEWGTWVLGLSLMMLGLVPDMFDLAGEALALGSAAVGLVLAGLVVWASHSLVFQDRFLSDDKAVEVTSFRKRISHGAKVKVLAEFDEISAVYLSPKVDFRSKNKEWAYPVMLLTKDGRSIPMGNQSVASDREAIAIPTALFFAETIGCDVYLSEERTPVKVVRQGHEFTVVPKDPRLGPLANALVAAAFGGLIWTLWYLYTQIQAGT